MPYRKPTSRQYALPTSRVTYPRRLSPMLAQEGKKEDIEGPTRQAQRKLDGTRIMIIKDGNTVKMMGARNWVNDYAPRYPQIVEDIRKLPVDRCIIDGELTFFKKGTDKDVFVNAMSKPEELRKLNVDVKAEMFDVLWVDDDNLEHLSFEDRDEVLHTMIPRKMAYLETLKTVSKNKTDYFNQLKAREGEGVILKEKESPYREGQRTAEWLKVKNWRSDEAVVVGYTQGQGARARTFGALILAKRDKKGNWRYVGKSAGLKEAEMTRLLGKMKMLETTGTPLADAPADLKAKAWVKPQIVAEVKYYEKTPYGIYRFPDFLRERTDKKPGECRL